MMTTIEEFCAVVEAEMTNAIELIAAMTALLVFLNRMNGGDGLAIAWEIWGPW